jgi:uncharacterized repeat protein (TIGR01451 family)
MFALFAIMFAGASQAAYINRFTTITNGAITFTGNTLGLNKAAGANAPGGVGSIGTFITTNTASTDGTFPAGTTATFANNSSQAVLVIPAGSTVLYAELVWGGSITVGAENVSATLNNSITFTTPLGVNTVTPAAATAQQVGTAPASRYVRSQNVTALVQAAGAGTYTVGGVPGTQTTNDDNNNTAGWTLAVVYGNAALPARDLTVFVGAEAGGAAAAAVTGFCTPPTGPRSGRLFVSALEGDSGIAGDAMNFGPTAATVAPLSGPNNPVANFFASQINIARDLVAATIDTSGTFGTSNQTPGTGSAGRQGYDITNVDISATLLNSQTSAFAQGTTTGDQYTIDALGIQINVGSPIFPTGVKLVDKAVAKVGDILTYSVVLNNTAGTANADNVTFTDVVPPGTSFVAGSFKVDGVTQAAANPVAGVNIGTIAAGASKTVSFQALVNTIPAAPATAVYSNSATWTYQFISCAGQPITTASLTTNPVLTNIARLAITKGVAPAGAVKIGQILTYTLNVNNDGTANSSTSTLIDAIPAGTTYVAGSTTLNGAPVTDAAGAMPFTVAAAINSPGQPAGQINVGATATVTFQVQVNLGPGGNTISNTATADVDGVGAALGVSASVNTPVTLTILPTIAKAFSPTPIAFGGTSTITFTLNNTNTVALTNANFTDALTNMSVSSATLGGTCVGTSNSPVLAVGATALNLTVPSLPVAGCTITVQVTSSNVGSNPNTTSGVTTTQTPTAGAVSNTANLVVNGMAPSIAKAFAPSPIFPGGTSTITFTLSNPNTIALSNANFTDALSNMSVSSTALGGTCVGTSNSPALVVGATALNLSIPSLPVAGCTVTVQVTSSIPGTNPNTTSGVTSTQTPVAGAVSNTANLVVNAVAPSITKTFAPSPIAIGGTSLITFALSNPNTIALSNANFTDALTNMSVSSTTLGGTCVGTSNSPALVVGATALNLTVPSLPVAGCTITLQVTSSNVGSNPNTTSGVTSTQTPVAGAVSNTANLTVLAPPTVTKIFLTNPVAKDAITKLSISISNPNSVAITGAAFADNYPVVPNNNLVNSNPTNAGFTAASISGGCTGTITATNGQRSLSLTGGTIPANTTCTITVDVLSSSNAQPTYVNTTGPITTTNAGTGTAASDSLVVVNGPTVSKSFTPASIPVGGTSQLTVNLSTTAGGAGTAAVAITDTYPAGIANAAGSPIVSNSCGGTLTAVPGGGSVSLSGGAIPPNSSCSFVINVTAASAGVYTNTIPAGAIASSSGPNPLGDSANLTVLVLPTVAKAFSPTSILAGAISTLTITLNNANAGIATLSSNLTDTLPTGVTVAAPSNLGGTCTGTKIATAGSGTVTYNIGGTIPANGSCTIFVDVTSVTSGAANNSIAAGALQTNNGTSPAAANATLTVNPAADLSITKTDASATYTPGSTGTYTLTVTNNGPSSVTAAQVTDNFPLGITLSGPWNCVASAGSSCSAASGGVVGGNAVTLTVNLLLNGTATITVPVQYSNNPANY